MKGQTDPSAVLSVEEARVYEVEDDDVSDSKSLFEKMHEDSAESRSNSGSEEEPNAEVSNECMEEMCERARQLDDWTEVFAKARAEPNEDTVRRIIIAMKRKLDELPAEEKRPWAWARVGEGFKDLLPDTLVELLVAQFFPGDSGIGLDVRPAWLDLDKFRRGQRFARDYFFAVSYADLLSLLTVFSFEDGLKPLIATGASSTPYTAFKRYLSTVVRVRNWYNSDPWTPGTPGYEDVRAVRRIHALVRQRMSSMGRQEREAKTSIANPWCEDSGAISEDCSLAYPEPPASQCPYALLVKYPETKFEQLNQSEMATTQYAFVGLIVTYPNFFGLHNVSDDDIEAFCHVWRGIGYLLGVEDEFNFCRGSLEDVRLRTRNFLEYWVKPNFRTLKPEWEHMVRCVIEGMQYYFPGSSYYTCVMDLARLLDMKLPKFYASMSYLERARTAATRFFFDHVCKLSVFHTIMEYRLRQVVDAAKEFDEKKHKQLQQRSAKTLQKCTLKSKGNNSLAEKYSKIDYFT